VGGKGSHVRGQRGRASAGAGVTAYLARRDRTACARGSFLLGVLVPVALATGFAKYPMPRA